jgi:hypothetical protein
MRRKKNNWDQYMAGAVGDKGYYIRKAYGPFRTKKIAEFFNFLAFGSPHSLNAETQSQSDISYFDCLDKAQHPEMMFRHTSPFGVWWQDTYGGPLTGKVILRLAMECNAKGYKSFTNWLVHSGTIGGRAPHYQYCSTLM